MQGRWNMIIHAAQKKCGIIMSETRLFHLRTVRGILGLSGLTGYQIKMEQREFIC